MKDEIQTALRNSMFYLLILLLVIMVYSLTSETLTAFVP
jgi:hypothetical protein